MKSIFDQPDAVHHLTDWATWQPWTTALVWLGLWLAVWGGVIWFATRLPELTGTQIGIAVVSLVPAFFWGSTADTVFRHIPSSTALKWIIISGILLFIVVGVWNLLNGSNGAAMSAAGGVLVLSYVGISEALTRIASGFPTSVFGLFCAVLFIIGLGWIATRRN
ncbi:hypothetical protein [Curtobacterium sp. PsM8]|uniref:hypothetical protein n=1 Tax=Curtobacterium sp. PsM8 TaxID=3030532 RepID=UPI00263AEE03|nr:hypothetical protein [Curtobacterium sp. PsM8]MDN4649272.1 hypothetical protein [Curtobacterium sp. PsM8]